VVEATPAASAVTTVSMKGTGPKTGEPFVLAGGRHTIKTSMVTEPDCGFKIFMDGLQAEPLTEDEPSGGSGSSTSETTTKFDAGTYTFRVETEGACGAWTIDLGPAIDS
jgi:hypothetical protein